MFACSSLNPYATIRSFDLSFLVHIASTCIDSMPVCLSSQKVLARNYELKLQNDDYKGVDPEIVSRSYLILIVHTND